jgi:hypothetical protein
LAYFDADGSWAQAGRKSFSKSNSFSGDVLITIERRQFQYARQLPLSQHGVCEVRLQVSVGKEMAPSSSANCIGFALQAFD